MSETPLARFASLTFFVILAAAIAAAPSFYAGALYGLPLLLPLALTARRRGVIVKAVAIALAANFCFYTGWYLTWFLPGSYPRPSAQDFLTTRLLLAALVALAFAFTFRVYGRRHKERAHLSGYSAQL